MSEYQKVFGQNAVIHVKTSRVLYLDQPETIHTIAYLEWKTSGGVEDEADIPQPLP